MPNHLRAAFVTLQVSEQSGEIDADAALACIRRQVHPTAFGPAARQAITSEIDTTPNEAGRDLEMLCGLLDGEKCGFFVHCWLVLSLWCNIRTLASRSRAHKLTKCANL